MKKILNKRKGIVLWITGISGSGKTVISKLIFNKFAKKYGRTIIFQGDELRKIFQFKDYSKQGRINNGLIYSDLLKKLSDQGINVIISVIGMFEKIRNKNRKILKNYIEIYIQCKVSKILKKTGKKHYKVKKNVVGIDIKPEFPKKPDIKITNNFKETPKKLADKIFKKIIQIT